MERRSSLSITFAVWRALFFRDAMHRLFYRRGAWVWLIVEPMMQIGFMVFIFAVLRVKVIGGIDTVVWLLAGLLGFLSFRRTMVIGMAAIQMAKPLFTYRQVRPVDAVLVRVATEVLLTSVIVLIIFLIAALIGVNVLPDNGLGVLYAFLSLSLLGLGSGLLISVPRTIIPEIGDVVNILIMPLYLLSGVIFPVHTLPEPYRSWLLLNPIVHVLEYMRASFADRYDLAPEININYPIIYAIILIFFGLIVQRLFEKKVIEI